jgi:hypothetical protein
MACYQNGGEQQTPPFYQNGCGQQTPQFLTN